MSQVSYPVSPELTPHLCGHCVITVDGIDVTSRCTFADPQHGFVICHVLDELGDPQIDPWAEEILVERLEGVVVVDVK